MNSLQIDRAGRADIEQILPLLKALFALEKDFDFEPDKARCALERMVGDRERICLLVARVDGEVVGMCSAQLVISTALGADSAWIEDVVVDSHWRGQGIGNALLTELEQWCRQQGATSMKLLADHDNHPALDFYRRNGWSGTNLIALKKSINT